MFKNNKNLKLLVVVWIPELMYVLYVIWFSFLSLFLQEPLQWINFKPFILELYLDIFL